MPVTRPPNRWNEVKPHRHPPAGPGEAGQGHASSGAAGRPGAGDQDRVTPTVRHTAGPACCAHGSVPGPCNESGHSHPDHDHDHDYDHDHDPGRSAARDAQALPAAGPGEAVTRLRIDQMDCPTEENLIRAKLAGRPEVRGLAFDLMQRVLTVVHAEPAREAVMADIRELGMTPQLLADDAHADDAAPAPSGYGRRIAWLAAAGVLAAIAEAAHFAQWPDWMAAVSALAAIALCGLSTYRKGWIAIRHGTLNINALMSIAVTGALAIGQWPEAAMVMVLFNLAELIEARSLDRARNAVRGLVALAPQTATVRQADGSWREVPAERLAVGDAVRVAPGERIAADGVVQEGASAVDQSAITGESLPVDKAPGDQVYAASVNTSGSFVYRVTAAAGDTTLARIIRAVQQAQGRRAPMQRFIDGFSRVYTPIVVGLAALVAIVPPLAGWMGWADAVYRALALLIIACPCALVISTPVSVVSALTAAARRGILVKGGAYLEAGRKLAWLALDKTGTLTHGRPVCTDLMIAHAAPDESPAGPAIASIVASLAERSHHPVSRALAERVRGQGRDDAQPSATARGPLPDVEDFAALPGLGVQGRIAGKTYYLGNRRLLRELGVADAPFQPEPAPRPGLSTATPPDARRAASADERLQAWEREGKSIAALTDGRRVLAIAAMADTLRPTSRDAVAQLHALGIATMMLTGDNQHAAQRVAREAGIDDARGDLLPDDKLAAIESRTGQGLVGMAGDGINDAPALARADIGFAMGAAGAAAAIETADVALMDDDLRKIPAFVRLSRATHRVLVQNIAFALGIKAVFLALAVAGQATLWMAVFADVGASLMVVANGLRLLRAGANPACTIGPAAGA